MRQGPRPGQRFSLTKPTVIIGREVGNDVVVNDPQVSRRHASLSWDGRQFTLQDLGSANGTFVNGERLTAPQVLQDGDVIGLGSMVFLGFQASSPVVSPSAELRTGPAEPPAHAPRPPARGLRRFLVTAAALLGLCGLLAVAAALGYFFLSPEEARPVVLINSPGYAEQVRVGQMVTIQATAREEGKVARVELWVDGQLQEAHGSNLPEGISPFGLRTGWQPLSPGTHTLTVRAFNTQGGRAHASVNVEAVELADRDGDGVADDADACPAEPGLPLAEGCPDADGDGVRDSEDACPDEPGPPGHDGCPVPGDLDGDGTPDAEDDCPEEPGSPEHAGCSDFDGDGTPDGEDDCLVEPGLPEHAGCSDLDGDGVPDAEDLCADVPGRPENYGCPDTGAGDRDGDRIPDDVDLAPDEPGLPKHGGCPPPGAGEDADHDSIPDDEEPPEPHLINLVPSALLWPDYVRARVRAKERTFVEFEVLEFEVSGDYDEVYCYAGLGGGDMERYGPFEPLGERQWDVAAYLGGENSRHIVVPEGEPLEVRVECIAYQTFLIRPSTEPPGISDAGESAAYYNLGSFTRLPPPEKWNGHVITAESVGGTEGHSFQATYRLCADSCEASALAPPILSLLHGMGDVQLIWIWEGDRESIDGFKVYRNGTYVFSQAPDRFAHSIRRYQPPCARRYEFHMTAYRGDQESPPSNTSFWSGGTCPSTARGMFFSALSADVLLITVGNDFEDPFVKPTVEEYMAVLRFREGLTSAYIRLDSEECLATYGTRVYPPGGYYFWESIRDALREIVRQTGASYILILGGRQNVPVPERDFPCPDAPPSYACETMYRLMHYGRPYDGTVTVPGDAWYIDFDGDDIIDEGLAIGPGAHGDTRGVEIALQTATALHNAGGYALDAPVCFSSAEGCYDLPPYGACPSCARDEFFGLMSTSDFITLAGHGTCRGFFDDSLDLIFHVHNMDSVNLHVRHPVIIGYYSCTTGLLVDPEHVSEEVTLATEFLRGGAAAFVGRTTTLGTTHPIADYFPEDIEGGMRIGDALFRRMRESVLTGGDTFKAGAGQHCLYGDPTLRRR
jgi:hypothetical protein